MAQGRKTGGRTKGTPNKATAEMRDLLINTFEQYAEGQLALDLKATDPETRLRFMVEVAKLVTPKPAEVTTDAQAFPVPQIVISRKVIEGREE
jgi:hypothetical protein